MIAIDGDTLTIAYIVAVLEQGLHAGRHAVMIHRHEYRVDDDAQRNEHVDERVHYEQLHEVGEPVNKQTCCHRKLQQPQCLQFHHSSRTSHIANRGLISPYVICPPITSINVILVLDTASFIYFIVVKKINATDQNQI